MSSETDHVEAAERGHVTRAVEVVLDPSPSEQRWLRSYVGSMRAAYNWPLAEVRDNLEVRRDERERGVPEDELTPALSWSRESLTARWRQVRDEVHPWWRDVSIHAFRTGIDNAAPALKNFSESRSGNRRGRKVGFPRFKNRHSRRRLDRVIARCQKGSENRAKLLRRRATLHDRIAATRKLFLHELSRRLAGGFDVVCVEDLNVARMARRKGLRNGRSVAEASMGELVRQLDYKTDDRSASLVHVGRFYPSSQTCSQCGARTKLALWQRVYHCTTCGLTLDRDVNAARDIRADGRRLMREQQQQDVASIRGEPRNGEPRPGETEPAQLACAGGHRSSEAATDPARPSRAGSRDLPVPVA